ncbi:MAG: GDSL-type esterase/lipase family protein [Thermomicrobiales bacterium]
MTPSIILTPDHASSRSGALAPTVAAGITTAATKAGKAWTFPAGVATVSLANVGQYLNAAEGAIFVRAASIPNAAAELVKLLGVDDDLALRLVPRPQRPVLLTRWVQELGRVDLSNETTIPTDVPATIMLWWDGARTGIKINDVEYITGSRHAKATFAAATALTIGRSTTTDEAGGATVSAPPIAGVLVFDLLPDDATATKVVQATSWNRETLTDRAVLADVRLPPSSITVAELAPSVAASVSRGARRGQTAVALGNSHVAANGSATNYPGVGWWGLLPILSGGRIRPVGWASTGGQTSAQLLARFDADVAPNAPDFVFVQEVTNDVGQGVSLASFRANFGAIWDKCLAIGAMPITIAGPPMPLIAADSPTNAKAKEVARRNLWLAEESARRGLIFVDVFSKLVDPTTGALAAAYYQGAENVHPNLAGHTLMAQTIWDAVGSLFPATTRVPLSLMKGEPTNLLANGVFVGDTNSDGVADNWTKSGAGATATLEAGVGDVLGNWQVLTINTAGAAYVSGGLIAPGPTTYQEGDVLMLSGRLKTTAGTTTWTPKVDRNATGSILRGIYQLASDVDGIFALLFTIPPGTNDIRPTLLSGPAGTGVGKMAQWMLRNLSAEARA